MLSDVLNSLDGDNVFEEQPVDFISFVESPYYLDIRNGLSPTQYYDVLQVIGGDPKKLFSAERKYDVGVFGWGKGSGKGFVSSIVASYVVYVLLCMKDPASYFGFPPGEKLDMLFVGAKGTQAERVIFDKFKQRILNSPWFTHNFLIYVGDKRVKVPDCPKGTIKIAGLSITFPKNIHAYSETSATESFEGYNLIFWVADEISAFISDKKKSNARKMFEVLRTSMRSRASEKAKGFGLCTSFPRQQNDIIFDLLKESEVDPNIYAVRRASWEVKPSRFYSKETIRIEHPRIKQFLGVDYIDVPETPYGADFKNPKTIEEALTRYACLPPLIAIGSGTDVGDSRILERGSPISVSFDVVPHPHKKGIWLYRVFLEEVNYRITAPIAFHIDLGQVNCRAVMAIGHWERIDKVFCKVVDDVIFWVPDKDKNIEVDILNIHDFVESLLKAGFRIAAASLDHWNSLEAIERFRTLGIDADAVSTRVSYDTLFSDFQSNSIYFNDTPGVREALRQLRFVDFRGKKLSEDEFVDAADALAGLSLTLQKKLHLLKPYKMPQGIAVNKKDISIASHFGTYKPKFMKPRRSSQFPTGIVIRKLKFGSIG